jgi:tetratricopeptide (TPR) repeat protein
VSGPEKNTRASLETMPARDDDPAAGAASEGDFPLVSRAFYEIGGEIARGGGGRLLRARDLRLDRLVAIKEPLAFSTQIERRFLREAVLTARLQHPSIVPVHEIGRWPSGEPFYAMKLVSGRSLRDVVAETTTIEQRVALVPNVLAVADAVAYAHGQGIIHRDLKPSNVMVGAFGETQVIDWGLAKELRAPAERPEERPGATARFALETDGIRGTPATMAPEQARGQEVDERADVYGIGALLYQVLAGGPPYAGDDSAEVIGRVLAGPPPPLARRAPRAPRELIAIAEHAMAREPAARYPSARELADDLRRFTNGQLVRVHRYSLLVRARRFAREHGRVLVAAVVSLSIGTAAAFAIAQARATRAPPLCPGAEPLLAGIWDDGRREAVRAAFLRTGKPYAADAVRGVEGALDRYAAAWVAMHGEACAATRVRGEQSSSLMDLRMECLQDRLVEMGALAGELAGAGVDGEVVAGARHATEELPSLSLCANAAALRAPIALPPDAGAHARLVSLRARLAHARALERTGHLAEALTETQQVAAAAKASAYPPIEAAAREVEGALLVMSGDTTRAVSTLEESILAAVVGRDEALEAQAWVDLVHADAEDRRGAPGREAARHAHAALVRSPDDRELAALLTSEAQIAEEEARYADSLALLDQSLALQQGTLTDELALARTVSQRGGVLLAEGRDDDALADARKALAIRLHALGPAHPAIAGSYDTIASILSSKGDYEGAARTYQQAIDLRAGDDAARDPAFPR